MIPIAISTIVPGGGEYTVAVELAGGEARLLEFDVRSIDAQLTGVAGVLLSGGGDVDPKHYGGPAQLSNEIDAQRDAFELALVARARERGLATLCVCRGLQVANVAFGGTLIGDIDTEFDRPTGALHCPIVNGKRERRLIPAHVVAIRPQSLLRSIVGQSPIVTGSRHHQSIARVAEDLDIVGATPDGIFEAVEARFASPFWLGVQWHPESTLAQDSGTSQAIFTAFVGAAGRSR